MTGIDRFRISHPHLKHARLAILTNHASFSATGYPVACELLRSGYSLRTLFSPEHGVGSQGEDGKAQLNITDPLTRLPVISLYGEKKMRPDDNDLRDIDIVLIDLPNIGCRFYTYWWTITHMLEVCSALKKKIILLDRPNLSGRHVEQAEGPLLDEVRCSSFLGRWSMPLTFSYSYGELMRWFIAERKIDVDHEIVPFDKEDKLHSLFIPPSPAINELHSIFIYPCTGLFEGVNLNCGRGTTFPFRVIGAPWIDSISLHSAFLEQQFAGIDAVPYSYEPVWSAYAGKICHGLYFNVRDASVFQPVRTGIWLLNYLSVRYPEFLTRSAYPTAANPDGNRHLDLLLGIENAFEKVCGGSILSEGQQGMLTDLSSWSKRTSQFFGR